MVSILHSEAEGEVVYLFDPESPRGNATFPFRSVRLVNPTDSALESGPVTVFGDGRFIGEGLTEPIPARATAFVPFALDRQVVVERSGGERDDIARILSIQHGVFSTESQHTRSTTFKLYNRMTERAVVYVRHTVAHGFKLKFPESAQKLGEAHLFRVEIEPHRSADLVVEEGTPVMRTVDVRTPGGLEAVKLYLSSAAVDGPLRKSVGDLLKAQGDIAKLEQQIATTREQMSEFRARMDELHVQVVSLKVVKTAGPLMKELEKKLGEMSDRISKATLDLVELEQKLMIARIRFQDGVAELSLEKA
jgi:hypothetical protein